MRFAITLVLALAALTGCAQSDQEPQTKDEGPIAGTADGSGGGSNTTAKLYDHASSQAFEWTAQVGGPEPFPLDFSVNSQGEELSFDVPRDARILYVNATWTCPAPTCPLEVRLHPGADGESVKQGDGEARFSVEYPTDRTWSIELIVTGASSEVDGTVDWKASAPEKPDRG